MALTPAERQRRYRAHRRGDHSMCDPSRCNGSSPEVPSSPLLVEFGPRGRRLWADMTDGVELSPSERVLLEEACRLADRLDRLDDLLSGRSDDWLTLHFDESGAQAVVVVDKALTEARQQQVALKTVLAEIRASRRQVAKPAGEPVKVDSTGVADLTARIAARRGSPAG